MFSNRVKLVLCLIILDFRIVDGGKCILFRFEHHLKGKIHYFAYQCAFYLHRGTRSLMAMVLANSPPALAIMIKKRPKRQIIEPFL